MPYKLMSAPNGLESEVSFHNRHNTMRISGEKTQAGIPLDFLGKNVSISNPEHHCLIVGATGMGKTRRLIFPSIILNARAGKSLFVIDPKGEAYRNCASELSKTGHDVLVVNLRNPELGNRYNVLTLVEDYWTRGFHDKAISMLRDISQVLFAGLADDRDKYWSLTASNGFVGVALLLLEHGKKLTFERVHSVFNEYVSEKALFDEKYRLDPFADSKRYLSSIESLSSDVTLSCIISTFDAAIAVLVGQPNIRDMMVDSDFNPTDLGRKKSALFVVCPDESNSSYMCASLLIEQLYTELIFLADSEEMNRLPVPVTFVLDEFGNLSGNSWANKLSAGRSREIHFILALQTLSQLKEQCGNNGAEVVMSNCRTWVFLGGKDMQMMNVLTSVAGVIDGKTVLPISDLNRLETGIILVFDGSQPYIGRLPDWDDWGIKEKATLANKVREPKRLEPISIKELLERKPEDQSQNMQRTF